MPGVTWGDFDPVRSAYAPPPMRDLDFIVIGGGSGGLGAVPDPSLSPKNQILAPYDSVEVDL